MGQIKNIKLHIVTDIKCHLSESHGINMFSKVMKPNGEQPDELENAIGEALLDLEVNSDLKHQLRELYITSAKELEIGGSRKCILIFVPVPLRAAFQKIQVRLVRELEKNSTQTYTKDEKSKTDATTQSYTHCSSRLDPRRSGISIRNSWKEDSSEVGYK